MKAKLVKENFVFWLSQFWTIVNNKDFVPIGAYNKFIVTIEATLLAKNFT